MVMMMDELEYGGCVFNYIKLCLHDSDVRSVDWETGRECER